MTVSDIRPAGRAAATAQLTAAEIMTRAVVTVRPDDSVLTAWDRLSPNHFHHLPVVSHDGRCVSIVDDRVVAAALATTSLVERRQRVADIMASRVHCVSPETPVARIARIMTLDGVRCLPVVDSRMRLLGVVTATDLVRLLAGAG